MQVSIAMEVSDAAGGDHWREVVDDWVVATWWKVASARSGREQSWCSMRRKVFRSGSTYIANLALCCVLSSADMTRVALDTGGCGEACPSIEEAPPICAYIMKICTLRLENFGLCKPDLRTSLHPRTELQEIICRRWCDSEHSSY